MQNELKKFEIYLEERENSPATISKYMRDVRTFLNYRERCGAQAFENDMLAEEIDKKQLLSYKQWLIQNYSVSSVNSMIVALNQFLIFIGLGRLRLRRVRVQTQGFSNIGKELTKAEFQRLVDCAKKEDKRQLALIMETMCATGIRISELQFFRVENVKNGVIKVQNKGKYRLILIPKLLRKKLLLYIKKEGIRSGVIFCTRSGKAKDRSNIWREMKQLAKKAGIDGKKVFPHNLRHLFARVFYKTTKNLINLANILGHSNLNTTRIYASEGIEEWKKNMEEMTLIEE